MTDLPSWLPERAAELDKAMAGAARETTDAEDKIAELQAEIERLRTETAELGNRLRQSHYASGWDAARELMGTRLREATDLLRAIRQWDHLVSAGDGPYWQARIDALLARLD